LILKNEEMREENTRARYSRMQQDNRNMQQDTAILRFSHLQQDIARCSKIQKHKIKHSKKDKARKGIAHNKIQKKHQNSARYSKINKIQPALA
jgi:hypothetical protein